MRSLHDVHVYTVLACMLIYTAVMMSVARADLTMHCICHCETLYVSSQLVMTPQTNGHAPNNTQSHNSSSQTRASASSARSSSNGLNVQMELQQLRDSEIQRNTSGQQSYQAVSGCSSKAAYGGSCPTQTSIGAASGTAAVIGSSSNYSSSPSSSSSNSSR
jgi:hypothetical protein